MPESVPNTPFSIDYLVTEVNTIVEDLRWLHFELKLRNNLNELLFRETESVEEFLQLGFEGFRAKMSSLEVTIYLRSRQGYSIGFRDLEDSVFWENDPVPWTDNLIQIFHRVYEREESPQPIVNHYTINTDPISVIAMPVVINREVIAVVTMVAHSSNLIPRYKKLLSGLSVALSISVHYIKNLRNVYKSAGQSAKNTGNVLSYEHVIEVLHTLTGTLNECIVGADALGNIILWNTGAERFTGIPAQEMYTVAQMRQTLTPGKSSAIMDALQHGTPFEDIVASIIGKNGIPQPFLWSLRVIPTTRGDLYFLSGMEVPDGNMQSVAWQAETAPQAQWIHQAITEISSVYIAVLDTDYHTLYVNPQLGAKLGTDNPLGQVFTEAFVPKHEQGYVESILRNYLETQGAHQSHEQFHLVSDTNDTFPVDWHLGLMHNTPNHPASLWLFGSEVPDELFQITQDQEMRQYPYRATEAKLSKHYRFLMKYVPFPILHLDESEDIIRNANLAFEKIIGTRNWESAPISDFGSLEIHAGIGNAMPCTVYLLSPEGITITYRGMITPLQIFGKNVREIKLDPLE